MRFEFNEHRVVIFVLMILLSVSFVFAVSNPGIFGHQAGEINWTMSYCSGGLSMIGITDSGVAACGPSTINSLAANDSSPA